MTTRVKQPRVSIIKNNVQVGDKVPTFLNDADAGMWFDNELERKGHKIDRRGAGPDLSELKVDNKSRKKGTKSAHTIGSMTIKKIIDCPSIFDTHLWGKIANQNQIEYDTTFDEVTKVEIVDFDLKEIREGLDEAWQDLRKQMMTQLANNTLTENITSSNGWAIFDGYGKNFGKSYRLRITPARMKKMKTISSTRDSFGALFKETQ
jgi:uncharacterized membrane protein YvbJ